MTLPATLTQRRYRVRIHDGTSDLAAFADPAVATGNQLEVTSVRGDTSPYIEGAPTGDGQELDPITLESSIGEYHVRVIDAVTRARQSYVGEDGFEGYGHFSVDGTDGLPAVNTAWTPLSAGDVATSGATEGWSLERQGAGGAFNPGGVAEGVKALRLVLANHDTTVTSRDVYVERTFAGLPASTLVEVAVDVGVGFRSGVEDGVPVGVRVGGIESTAFALGQWVTLTVQGTSTAGGELTVQLGAFGFRGSPGFPEDYPLQRLIYFDALRIYVPPWMGEERIVTRELADAAGAWQLLSRRAAIEQSEDGATWTVLTLGYLNALTLSDALVWDLTIGETRRVELAAEIYARSPAPVNSGGVIVTPTCIIGGPLISGVTHAQASAAGFSGRTVIAGGPQDFGPVRFEVHAQEGHADRQLDLQIVSGFMQPFFQSLRTEYGNGGTDPEIYAVNAFAREFFSWEPDRWKYDAEQQTSVYGWFPGLVARMQRVSDGQIFETHPLAMAARRAWTASLGSISPGDPGSDDPVGTVDNMVERARPLRVDWDEAVLGTKPTPGTQFDVWVYPARPTERFPVVEVGAPLTLLTRHYDALGVAFDAASHAAIAASIDTVLGGAAKVELIHAEPVKLSEYKARLYGFFGIADRVNAAGELQVYGVRTSPPESLATITAAMLRDPGSVYDLNESSVVTSASMECLAFAYTRARPPIQYEETQADRDIPPNLTRTAKDRRDGYADPDAASAPRSHTFELPGRLLVDGKPVELTALAVAAGTWLVNWRGGGVPEVEIHCLPSATAQIGDRVELSLPHLPVPVVGADPVTQRGQAPQSAIVLRRTETPAGPDLLLEYAPPTDQPALAAPGPISPTPTPSGEVALFTLSAYEGDPTRIVLVTITNAVDLAGASLRYLVQFAVGSTSAAPTTIGPYDPDSDPSVFLPSVPAGSTVYVRTMVADTYDPWSAWQSIALGVLTTDVVADFGSGDEAVMADFGSGDDYVTATF